MFQHPSTELYFDEDYYPSMEQTKANLALLQQIDKINQKLGLGPITPYTPKERGAADSCFVSSYLPTIDGLGAIGDHAHLANKEFFDKKKSCLATQRVALFIKELTSGLNDND